MLLLVFLSAVSITSCSQNVPVVIWKQGSNKQISADVGDQVSSKEFSTSALPKVLGDQKKTLVFIQDALSVEDYSLYHDDETPFKNVQSSIVRHPSVYIESVENPVSGIKVWGDAGQTYHELADNVQAITDNFVKGDNDRVTVYVHLPTTTENQFRKAALSRNDEIMAGIVSAVSKEQEGLAVIFTGRRSLWDAPGDGSKRIARSLLESTAAPPPRASEYSASCKVPVVEEISQSLLLYVCKVQISLNKKWGTVNLNDTKLSSVTISNGTTFEFTVKANKTQTKFSMSLSRLGGDAWESTASINGDSARASQDVYAPAGFSYHCTPGTKFTAGNITITFLEFQIQGLYGNKNGTSFGRPYDCIGMMSVPILSGLFVVLILTLIMAWALSMIMNIKTMDRFDDPKGASISVPLTD